MQTSPLCSVLRCVALLALLWTAGSATAQSTADQQLKDLPQTVKDNGETKVVTKTNTTSTNAMNKLDSAGNKAFKGFTGLFKKKNKPKKTDSTATRPPDSTQGPKSSWIIRLSPATCIATEQYAQETTSFINRKQRKNYLL